jgi:hypothetical protein
MIEDTCLCGANVRITGNGLNDLSQHRSWLEAHAVCRERSVGPEWGTNGYTLIGEPATLVDEIAVWDPQAVIRAREDS